MERCSWAKVIALELRSEVDGCSDLAKSVRQSLRGETIGKTGVAGNARTDRAKLWMSRGREEDERESGLIVALLSSVWKVSGRKRREW